MESLANDIELDEKIFVEQINALYKALWPMITMSFLSAIVIIYAMWDVISHITLISWLSLHLLAYFQRAVLYYSYQRNHDKNNLHRYALHFVISIAITGCIWGIGLALMLPPEKIDYQLLMLFMVAALAAGAVSPMSSYKPCFLVYMPTLTLPIAITFIFMGDSFHLSLGLLTLAYLGSMYVFSLNIHKSFTESIKLRFENIDLVEQLREQKNEADHANMAKSKFLAAASHDLRQPLHAITLFTSVLDEYSQEAKNRIVIDQIKSSVKALQNLFNALLDISKLDAGAMKAETSSFFLANIFQSLANDYNPEAKKKSIHINWPDCSYAVHTDQTLLEQILRNYISNAIRYTNEGEISINCVEHAGEIVIKVTDTGIGIPDEELQAIFGEFHQLSNPERDRGKGLGLGLAIVKRTANLLGHSIKVESQPGMGSTFSIAVEQVSINEAAQSVDELSALSNLHTEETRLLKSNTLIIVIDDERSIREGMKSLLQLWNCEVVTAADETEALTLLSKLQRTPDGIIADYRLREEKTGVEAIHAIHREYHGDIPALIVTGDIAVERLHDVNRSGFQMLHKPVAPVKLRAFLRNVQRNSTSMTTG